MELIDEQTHPPFISVCIFTFFIIVGAFVATRLIDPGLAAKNKFYWYMARSAGFTSYGLLSVTVLLGLSSTSSIWDRWRLRRFFVQLHQYAALLIVPFLLLHLLGLHQDASVPFRWLTLLVPFLDGYRPIPTGLGILTLYGVILLITSSYFREKIGPKAWRTIHYASIPMFIFATFHGLLTGTDTKSEWGLILYTIPTFLFIVLLMKRISKR